MSYIDIHNERVWIPERPLRSMDEARPMRDGDLWRCPTRSYPVLPPGTYAVCAEWE